MHNAEAECAPQHSLEPEDMASVVVTRGLTAGQQRRGRSIEIPGAIGGAVSSACEHVVGSAPWLRGRVDVVSKLRWPRHSE